jgi:hypothetical protein
VFKCIDCQLANLKTKPFDKKNKRYKELEVVAGDICGLIKHPLLGNNGYVLSLADMCAGFVQVKMLKTKEGDIVEDQLLYWVSLVDKFYWARNKGSAV